MLTIPPELGRRYDTWLERKPGRVRSAYLFRALPGMACYQSYARNEGTRCVPYAGVDVAV